MTFSPFLQGRYRFADVAESEYYRLDMALGIEAKLNDRWSIVSTPFFEAYWFTGGLNSGPARPDLFGLAGAEIQHHVQYLDHHQRRL